MAAMRGVERQRDWLLVRWRAPVKVLTPRVIRNGATISLTSSACTPRATRYPVMPHLCAMSHRPRQFHLTPRLTRHRHVEPSAFTVQFHAGI